MTQEQLAGLATGQTIVSMAIAQLLIHRGILTREEIESAVRSALRGATRDPYCDPKMAAVAVEAFLSGLPPRSSAQPSRPER